MAEGTLVAQNIPADSQPIDRWDWFKLSRTWVTGAEDRLQKQVEGIQNAIKWFFGIGSSATIVSVLLKDPKLNTGAIWLFALALLCLLIAYALSTVAITIVSRAISNPNNADCIREEFNKLTRHTRVYLIIASSLLLVGMFLFPVAIIASIKIVGTQNKTSAAFTAVGGTRASNKIKYLYSIDISGYTPDSTSLVLKLEKGLDFSTASVVGTFRHTLNHSYFDYTMSLTTPLALDSTAVYYISLLYRIGVDSLHSQSIRLRFTPE